MSKHVGSLHKVEVLPYVTDIEPYLDWSDAVVMPSRWELNPLVVWEARARGRGTIASDIDVFRDLSGSGPIWTFHNESAFASVLEKLATDPTERTRAFNLALESFKQLSTRSSIVEYLDV
ncbi:glycosyltransferase involved in cell wall biosynthesis [Arthrobacter sp. UYCo732]